MMWLAPAPDCERWCCSSCGRLHMALSLEACVVCGKPRVPVLEAAPEPAPRPPRKRRAPAGKAAAR